jgi:hypothetical protein
MASDKLKPVPPAAKKVESKRPELRPVESPPVLKQVPVLQPPVIPAPPVAADGADVQEYLAERKRGIVDGDGEHRDPRTGQLANTLWTNRITGEIGYTTHTASNLGGDRKDPFGWGYVDEVAKDFHKG